jgi:hypothetical protein
MSNVLSEEKKQQVIALGRLGWPLRRIEQATGVRRETAGAYLKAARITVRLPGAWGRRAPAKPAIGVTPDFVGPISEKQGSPRDTLSTSSCEPYRELIEQGLARRRNGKAIWQDLVSDQGFAGSYQTVKRFVRRIDEGIVDVGKQQQRYERFLGEYVRLPSRCRNPGPLFRACHTGSALLNRSVSRAMDAAVRRNFALKDIGGRFRFSTAAQGGCGFGSQYQRLWGIKAQADIFPPPSLRES